MIVTDIIQRPTGFVKGAAKSGEVGALPQTPPKKLFEKSFFGIFKNL
jgi:hypothetical protein